MDKRKFELTSFHLHIAAMALMLCDHLWATVIPGNDWLTNLGRIAFPLFAFMTVEGFFHTKDLKKYVKRLFIFALVSEIPFNLMMGGSAFYPLHQNVLWTFLIGTGLMYLNEKVKKKNIFIRIIVAAATAVFGYIIGIITFSDYNGAGVLTVLLFYFFRGKNLFCRAMQVLGLWYINTEILSGYFYVVDIFGRETEILRQSFAVLSLIPIFLYDGKQGPYNKNIRALYYWFYPVHMIILYAAKEIILFFA